MDYIDATKILQEWPYSLFEEKHRLLTGCAACSASASRSLRLFSFNVSNLVVWGTLSQVKNWGPDKSSCDAFRKVSVVQTQFPGQILEDPLLRTDLPVAQIAVLLVWQGTSGCSDKTLFWKTSIRSIATLCYYWIPVIVGQICLSLTCNS